VWGTCAGLIFLAEEALGEETRRRRVACSPVAGQKQGGQVLIGGLDVQVSRNFFGSQVDSFETQLAAPSCLLALGGEPTFHAVFIRAPAILSCGAGVEVLAEYDVPAERAVALAGVQRVVVAARQGSLLGTAFHPEITQDTRWHQLFLGMCLAAATQ